MLTKFKVINGLQTVNANWTRCVLFSGGRHLINKFPARVWWTICLEAKRIYNSILKGRPCKNQRYQFRAWHGHDRHEQSWNSRWNSINGNQSAQSLIWSDNEMSRKGVKIFMYIQWIGIPEFYYYYTTVRYATQIDQLVSMAGQSTDFIDSLGQ